MSSAYLYLNAWREICARVFNNRTVQSNISPEWLVNPASRRPLKLDYLYLSMGVAVRFMGLTAKGQGRRSEWDLREEEQRNQTRVELCRLNGIQLAMIDPFDEPAKQMDRLLRVLSRASRLTAQDGRSSSEKKAAMDELAAAIKTANQLRMSLSKNPDQMIATLAEAWRDQETGLITELQQSTAQKQKPTRTQQRKLAQLACGQKVIHTHFGTGVVTDVSGDGAEKKITIYFDADKERTFLASLLADKITMSGVA